MLTKTINILTIDVEDYWSVFFRDWLNVETQPTEDIVKNAEWFLEVLAQHNVKATFFILGDVAKTFPSLIKKIAENGHEVAVHGFFHKQIFKLTEEGLRREVGDCKKLLEDIISDSVSGHRAPAFSVMPTTKWALEVLADEGFKYDSSVYPISGRRYGWPGFNRDICRIDLPSGRNIIEVPMSTITILGKTLPAAGGGYIRHFPYIITSWAMKRLQKERPAIVYIHPHEIETRGIPYPTKHMPWIDRINTFKYHHLQMRNRNSMPQKIAKLLSDFKFATVSEVIALRFPNR